MDIGNTRAVWLDYLRSFVTLLVVAHHAALAYPTFAHFDPTHYIYSTAPIVDDHRWIGMDTFIGFNDLFFMPLMFLISGLFVYRGLIRKGVYAYLTDRFIRLGIPFLIAELILIPLAYAPSFYQATHTTNFIMFIRDYVINQQWPVGPPWFIWLLLAFDGVTVLIFSQFPSFFLLIGQFMANLSKRPARLLLVVYSVVCLSLIPLSLWVGQYTWVGHWGPFDFQLNRLLFYLLFFLAGSCLGATDWQSYLFRAHKFLGQDWTFWFGCSLVCYLLFMLTARAGAAWVEQGRLTSGEGYFMYDLAFVASCLASISACFGFFKQKITSPIGGWSSLSANAYGIYIVHYSFVTWFQFALLKVDLPVEIKFIVVFSTALALSWISTSLARRNLIIARIL